MPLRRLACTTVVTALVSVAPALLAGVGAASPSIAPPEVAPVLTAIALRAERDRAEEDLAVARWGGDLAAITQALSSLARADSLHGIALAAIGDRAPVIPRAVLTATGMGARSAALARLALDLAKRGQWRAADALLSGAPLREDRSLRAVRAVARSRAMGPREGLAALGWPPERRPPAGVSPDSGNAADLALWAASALSDSAALQRAARAALWILVERSDDPAMRRRARLSLARRLGEGGEPRLASAVLERERARSPEETLLLARFAAAGGDSLGAIRRGLEAAEQSRTAAERYAALLPAARAALGARCDSLDQRQFVALATGLGNLGEAALALRLLDARTAAADSAALATRSELRASLLLKARRFADAADVYRQLLAASFAAPASVRAPLALGLARALRGARSFEAMDSAFVLAAGPDAPVSTRETAAWERAREWEDSKSPAEAAPVFAWCREQVATGPLAASAQLHTAILWDRAGRQDSARARLASPRDAEGALWFWQGRFAIAAGDSSGARYAFNRTAQATPLSYEGVRAREELGLDPVLTAPGAAPRSPAVPLRSAKAPGLVPDMADVVGLADIALGLLRACAQGESLEDANGCIDALESRGIYRVGRRGPQTELRLTRPPAFPHAVLAAAAAEGVDPALLWALMLQESAFDATARSRAGAIGLLQLLPATASRLAGRPVTADSLADPALNVDLAARYVARLLREFRDPRAAMAAYNAGEDAVRRWVTDRPVVDDRWVELIPYRETRDYVKSVYTTWRQYAAIYDAR